MLRAGLTNASTFVGRKVDGRRTFCTTTTARLRRNRADSAGKTRSVAASYLHKAPFSTVYTMVLTWFTLKCARITEGTDEQSRRRACVRPTGTSCAIFSSSTIFEFAILARDTLGLAFQGLERSGLAVHTLGATHTRCKFPHTTVLTHHHSHCIAVRARPTELTRRAVGVLVIAASRTIRTSEQSSVCAGVGPCRTVTAVLRTRTRLETAIFARNTLGLAFQGLERSGRALQTFASKDRTQVTPDINVTSQTPATFRHESSGCASHTRVVA